MGSPEHVSIELTGQHLAVYRALAERSEQLAGWYLGARLATNETANPERFVHAAHSLRELMEKLSSVMNLPAKVVGGRLGDQVAKMEKAWERAKSSSSCHADGVLTLLDEIPADLRTGSPLA